MVVLIDILLVWALISVCITPILLVIQTIINVRWYMEFYAVIINKQGAKDAYINSCDD